MKGQIIALIALRLTAVFLFIQAINFIPTWITMITTSLLATDNTPAWLLLLNTVLPLSSFILPLIIWCYSKWLATLIVVDAPSHVQDSKNQLNEHTLLNIALMTVGVLVFLLALPELITWLSQTIIAISKSSTVYEAPHPWSWLLLPPLLKTLLSLILIFKSSTVANFCWKRFFHTSTISTTRE